MNISALEYLAEVVEVETVISRTVIWEKLVGTCLVFSWFTAYRVVFKGLIVKNFISYVMIPLFQWWQVWDKISVVNQSVYSINFCLYKLSKTWISHSWATNVLNLNYCFVMSQFKFNPENHRYSCTHTVSSCQNLSTRVCFN